LYRSLNLLFKKRNLSTAGVKVLFGIAEDHRYAFGASQSRKAPFAAEALDLLLAQIESRRTVGTKDHDSGRISPVRLFRVLQCSKTVDRVLD